MSEGEERSDRRVTPSEAITSLGSGKKKGYQRGRKKKHKHRGSPNHLARKRPKLLQEPEKKNSTDKMI